MKYPTARTLIGDRHALGHPEIDQDHFAISESWRETMQCGAIELPLRIARMRKLMRTHFDNEANLVEAAGSTFCSCHKREHDSLLALCDDAFGLAERDWRGARALLRVMPKLVRDHIISMDQIAVLIIHTAQDRAIPA